MKDVNGPPSRREMPPADSYCNSPPSPSPLSASTPQWIVSPSRIRDSASGPRRSLLSSHFSASLPAQDAKVQQQQQQLLAMADELFPVPVDLLSKSLPSPPIAAFLDPEEEEALEPSTPPHVGASLVPPLAPRKSFRQRAAPRGKHKPRRLLFQEVEGGEVKEPSGEGEGSSQPAISSIPGDTAPPRQRSNSLVLSNPCKRIHTRELR